MDIKKLEEWYLANRRDLPFRRTKDPYQIWVSEIMLQQTQVDTVLPFFNRFITKYPILDVLASAKEETLQKDIEGLGYYRRFRNMHLAAKQIVSSHPSQPSVFPSTYENLIQLPGIGKYTAGAIMSIAFNKPYSALDGNVIRVLSRFLEDTTDMRREINKKRLNQINQSFVEKATPNVYTQAMMELGATICRPKQPKCDVCPLKDHCLSFRHGTQDSIPVLSKLKTKETFYFITLILKDDMHYYLRKRDENLLKGMYEWPQFPMESILSVLLELEAQNINIEITSEPKMVQHVFTHQIWHMEVYEAYLISGKHPTWVNVPKENFHLLPMATAHRKIKKIK
ncbi:MAG: A/G-specific adenine glycosylase [Acholeplasmataceae bacterium]|nr:A/G-specific adenine glycosylase [Acholeplasmataceae bacterium]